MDGDNIVNLADAKRAKKAKSKGIEIEEAPLELYPPVATLIPGTEDYMVRGCDGDDEYIWIATLKKGKYKVAEVYPGERKRSTAIRDLRESDLELDGRYDSLSDVLEEIDAIIMDGVDLDGTDD